MSKNPVRSESDCFVADGHDRLVGAVEVEVRSQVEQTYAAELDASGTVKRWFLKRRIKREVAELVTKRTEHISPESLF